MSTEFRPLSTQVLCALELLDLNSVDTSWSAFNYYIDTTGTFAAAKSFTAHKHQPNTGSKANIAFQTQSLTNEWAFMQCVLPWQQDVHTFCKQAQDCLVNIVYIHTNGPQRHADSQTATCWLLSDLGRPTTTCYTHTIGKASWTVQANSHSADTPSIYHI